MYVDPGIVTFYLWVHVILLGIVGGILLYQTIPYDEDDYGGKKPNPDKDDEGWPGW